MKEKIGGDGDSETAPERTFQSQHLLPSLPVPDLRKTLEKYLRSVRIHSNPNEYEKTKRIVDEFERGIGSELHRLLVERGEQKRNWLEEWWEDNVYLKPRYPLMPLVNFGGASPKWHAWPPCPDAVVERCALTVYWILRYWRLVRRELVPVQYQRGKRWCMNQLHRLFNTCRIPGEHKDQMKYSFKSSYEGDCPSHIVVMDHGQFWRVDILDPNTGEICTPPQLEACLDEIRRLSRSQVNIVPIGSLTCLDRTDWFTKRQHLLQLSPENAAHLNTIEEAIFIVSFTDESPTNDDQLAVPVVCPKPDVTWADKSIVWHVHKNGIITSNSDHSFADAIVVIQMTMFVDQQLAECQYKWKGSPSKLSCPRGVQLKFVTDSRTVEAVGRALSAWHSYVDDLNVMLWHYTAFGDKLFKKCRVYGDTAVQLAMQLAYFRLHHRPGATYETATTKQFYHGRTETVRSCTGEAVEWAKSMLNPSENVSNRRVKFRVAIQKHNRMMAEAMNGEGCDRHLLGLRIIAEEKGLPTPAIYTDNAWKKSGGDGNFVVSSSFVGYSNVWGGCVPMCTDGYGTFYNIRPDSIAFHLSTWKSSKETSVVLWRDSLEYALMAIKELLEMDAKHVAAKY